MTETDAFANLVAQGEALIAAGRPVTPFSALRYQEPQPRREECPLSGLAVTEAPAAPTPEMASAYAKLLGELQRFAPAQILFSALEPGQGTSFTAANLAVLWAREAAAEENFLYVEFYCGPRNADTPLDARGEIFADAYRLEDFLCATAEPRLFRLTVAAGGAMLDGMLPVWKRLTATFAHVFIDASPAGFNPLVPWLGAHASGTVLVARKAPDGKTVNKFADKLASAGGRFMGVIMNA